MRPRASHPGEKDRGRSLFPSSSSGHRVVVLPESILQNQVVVPRSLLNRSIPVPLFQRSILRRWSRTQARAMCVVRLVSQGAIRFTGVLGLPLCRKNSPSVTSQVVSSSCGWIQPACIQALRLVDMPQCWVWIQPCAIREAAAA